MKYIQAPPLLGEGLQESIELLFSLSGAMALKFWEGIQLRIGDFHKFLSGGPSIDQVLCEC